MGEEGGRGALSVFLRKIVVWTILLWLLHISIQYDAIAVLDGKNVIPSQLLHSHK